MPSTKLCPKCNQLPTISFDHIGIKKICSIGCSNIGCFFCSPIVITGFNKEKITQKAIDKWNQRVENYRKIKGVM